MFELINKFKVKGKSLFIVKTNGGVSVMEETEYKKAWGNYHRNKWSK